MSSILELFIPQKQTKQKVKNVIYSPCRDELGIQTCSLALVFVCKRYFHLRDNYNNHNNRKVAAESYKTNNVYPKKNQVFHDNFLFNN